MAAELSSPADYYRRERMAEFKSEFYAGEVFALAGGSVNHSLIKANVVGTMRDALRKKGGGCRAFDSDLRVAVATLGSLAVALPLAEIFMGVTFPPPLSFSVLEKT